MIPNRDTGALNVLLGGALLIALTNALIAYCRSVQLIRLEARLDSHLMLGFFRHLMSLPYRFFQQRSSGDLLMRLASNASIREALANHTTTAVLDGGLVVVSLAALLWICFPFGLLALAIAAGEVALLCVSAPRLHCLAEADLACQTESQSCLMECLLGVSTLKASGNEQRALDRWVFCWPANSRLPLSVAARSPR